MPLVVASESGFSSVYKPSSRIIFCLRDASLTSMHVTYFIYGIDLTLE